MFSKKHILFLIVLLLWPLFGPGSAGTPLAAEPGPEYQIKAAFLINFAKFITWPPQAFSSEQQEFVLCVAGDDPFGGALAGIENKTIAGRPIKVIRTPSLKRIPPCHLLFACRSESANLGQLASLLAGKPVVTVSDIDGFANAGGLIEFVVKGGRLSFVINHTAMKEHNLQVNASLLDLAAAVL